MQTDEFELTEAERAAFAALPRERAPGEVLEQRVVRALRAEGYLGAPPISSRGWRRTTLRAAAAIGLFAGGVATGRYPLLPEAEPQRAAAAAPASVGPTTADPAATSPAIRPPAAEAAVRRGEIVVAEREMWL